MLHFREPIYLYQLSDRNLISTFLPEEEAVTAIQAKYASYSEGFIAMFEYNFRGENEWIMDLLICYEIWCHRCTCKHSDITLLHNINLQCRSHF